MSEDSIGLYQNGMSSGTVDLQTAVVPLLKLLCLTVIGLLLANSKLEMIPRSTFKLLNKLVFALFLPCLIFTELGSSITLKNFVDWWFIPVNVLVSTALGCILGFLVVIICHPPPQFNRLTIIMTGFGNTGNLPLAVVGSVCHTSNNPFGNQCNSRGVAYVSLSQWVSVILFYTLVYHMMKPPMEYYEIVGEGAEIQKECSLIEMKGSLHVEAERPVIEDKEAEHSETPFIAKISKSISDVSPATMPDLEISPESNGNHPRSIRPLAEPTVARRIRIAAEETPILHIPLIIASLLAIIIGTVPQLKAFVFGYEAPLSFITDSLEILAGAMVPSVMLILGGMLAEGPNESTLGRRTTIGIVVTRLLVLPLLGIGIVALSDKLHFLVENDAMFRFVVLLQYTTPSAILLGAIANLRGYAISEASALLFWQHIFALFSLTLYVVIYYKIVLYI